MVKFIITQIRLGRLTLEGVKKNPKTSKYYDAVKAEMEAEHGS